MLAREKQRAVWSLVVGVVAASGVAGWSELRAYRLDNQAKVEVAKCEAKDAERRAQSNALPPAKRSFWDKAIEICDPADFVPDKSEPYVRGQDAIADLEHDAQAAREGWPFWSLVVFGISCIPLVWYFLLDRIREISAAVSGRDRSN
jgi:hypothetical protein